MPSLRRASAVLLAVVVPVAAALPAAGAVEPAVAPTTVLTVEGRQGAGSLDRASLSFSGQELALALTAPGTDALSVEGSWWEDEEPLSLRVAPVGGTELVEGLQSTYQEQITLSLSSWEGVCGTEGSVDVLALERSGEGDITSLAFDYQVACTEGLVEGSVRWSSDEPYRSTVVEPPPLLWARTDEPVRGTATLTNAGSLPITYGATTFETLGHGDDPLVPDVVVDGCDGRTVPPGQSCALQVEVTSPDGWLGADGFLATEDGSARGAVYTEVVVFGARYSADGAYEAIDPVRVVDTRDGTGGRLGPLGQQQTMTFDPSLTGDVPQEGVSAVLLNVTGTAPTQPTHVRVWPSGTPVPGTSSLNLARGQDRANQVLVPVGADGKVSLFNNVGSTHLVVDVQGYYSTAEGWGWGDFHPVEPSRVLDTRDDGRPLGPGEVLELGVAAPGVDWSTVTAVDVNLTVTEPTTAGHLTAWPGGVPAPGVSNLNFARGQTVANHAVLPVSIDGNGEPYVALRNSNGRTHVVVDVQGWYDDGSSDTPGLRFAPSPTVRVADTRLLPGTLVGAGGSVLVPASSLPDQGVAHVVNITSTASTGPGHLTAWSGTGPRPMTSAVNYARAEDSPNLATVLTGADGRIAVTANSSPSHVVVDHLGYFW